MAFKGIGFSCNSTDKCTKVTEYPPPPKKKKKKTATLVAGHWTKDWTLTNLTLHIGGS